jgi:hypothetical protein
MQDRAARERGANNAATSPIRHLHDFVRDVELTEAEWLTAIRFLTRVGQACTDKRQEFILLSDTLGVSILVDAINHRMPTGAVESTVLGPWYIEGAPELPLGSDISNGAAGEDVIRSNTGAEKRVTLPLHGTIANCPAWRVCVRVQLQPPYELSVRSGL